MTDQNEDENDDKPGFEIDCEEVHAVAAAALNQHQLSAQDAAILPLIGLPVTCRCGRSGTVQAVQDHALHEMVHAIMHLLSIKTDLGRHDSLAGTPVEEGWVDGQHD